MDRERVGNQLRELFGNVTLPVLALLAVVVYGLLSLIIDNFYRSLGVDLADVGLNYANILSRAAGLIVYVLVFLLLAAVPVIFFVFLKSTGSGSALGRTLLLAAATFLVLWSIFTPIVKANDAAQAVKDGRPVRPVLFGPLTLLPIRAYPVTIRPIGKEIDGEESRRLSNREFLYLGQASNIVVLYDPNNQRTVYLSLSSTILEIENCGVVFEVSPQPDESCIDAYPGPLD